MGKKSSLHIIRTLFIAAVMALVMAVGAFAAQTGVITEDIVNVRTGPGTSYDRVETLAKGKVVTILGEESGWYHISWANSKGYVLCVYVAVNGAAQADATVTGGSTINVRSGPGTSYDRIAMVGAGKRVAILGKEGDWYKISFDGKTGYILGDYLIPDNASSASSQQQSTSTAADTSGNAVVTGGSTINVRSGPGTDYGRVAMVGTGKRVTLLAVEDNWYKISFDGKTGYILSDYLTPDAGVLDTVAAAQTQEGAAPAGDASPAEVPVASADAASVDASSPVETAEGAATRSGFITGGTINVRTGPGTDYDRITQVHTGKPVNIISEENGWYLVSFGDVTGYVLADYIYEGDSLPASAVGEQVALMAQQYLGTRYVYGGASPSGFDCSGFTLYLYRQFGYSLPHTASGQYANCGYKVSRDSLLPGDLVFFTSPGNGGRINHVGIYIGNGNIIHARMSVGKVYINSLSESYYSRNYVGAIRIA